MALVRPWALWWGMLGYPCRRGWVPLPSHGCPGAVLSLVQKQGIFLAQKMSFKCRKAVGAPSRLPFLLYSCFPQLRPSGARPTPFAATDTWGHISEQSKQKGIFSPLDPNPILKLLTAQTGLAQSCTLGCTGRTGSAGGTEEFSQPLVAEQEPSCSHPL